MYFIRCSNSVSLTYLVIENKCVFRVTLSILFLPPKSVPLNHVSVLQCVSFLTFRANSLIIGFKMASASPQSPEIYWACFGMTVRNVDSKFAKKTLVKSRPTNSEETTNLIQ